MDDSDDPKSKLRLILGGKHPKIKKSKPKTANKATVIGDGNIVQSNVTIKTEKVTHRKIIQPPEGSVTPAQKQRIKELVEAIVHNTGSTFPSVWVRLHKKFRTNSYHELSSEQYPKVLTWLQQWYASTK